MNFRMRTHPFVFPQANRIALVCFAAVISAIVYLLAGNVFIETGYPLDDAWIHQTYARNLVTYGEWSFIPGIVSGGSTSPLWTLILSFGHGIGFPGFWTFAAGVILLCAAAIIGVKIFVKLGLNPITSLIFGLFLATEWHLVWASVSGMETILVIFIILLFFYFLFNRKHSWAAGMLIGIAVWIRPDSISLIGPWLWVNLFLIQKNSTRLKGFVTGNILLFLFTGLYLGFNHSLTGNLWPNTFYAKQAEYAAMQETPILIRYFRLVSLPWIGASVLLLPGLFFTIMEITRHKKFAFYAPILWALGYILIFAARLPVTYQHGRYIMPAMPVLFLVGYWGFQKAIQAIGNYSAWRRILRAAWICAMMVTQVSFFILGAGSFSRDVAFINAEMVTTARWIAENTETGSLIAAHDIGALGYFSDREIIDLAGLVTPEVIPFIRDENKLAAYITGKKADYLMIFPGWYPQLADEATPVYHSNTTYSPDLGGESMYVYRWIP